MKELTEQDFQRAAKKLKCSVSTIMAVAQVESAGAGFYADGFPKILFERHLFRKFTNGRYNQSHPHLSGSQGGYGAAGRHQRNKFSEAFALNADAAMKACSWGKFQILGSNHKVCGYNTVGEFVDAMKADEGKHLDAFVNFVIGNNLARFLRVKDFASFARGYNGPAYRKNKYDTKMATAEIKFARQGVNSLSAVSTTASFGATTVEDTESTSLSESSEAPQVPPTNSEVVQNADTIVNTGNATSTPTPEDKTLIAPPKDGATATAAKTTILGIGVPSVVYAIFQGISDIVEKGYIDAKEIGSTVLGLVRDHYKYVFVLIGLIIVLLIIKKIVKQVTFWITMITQAVPGWNNITVVPTVAEPKSAWWQIWK